MSAFLLQLVLINYSKENHENKINKILIPDCQRMSDSFEGKSHYGFRTFHNVSKVLTKGPLQRLEMKTMILFKDMRPITINKSQEHMFNFRFKLQYVNCGLQIGKFCHSNSTGELTFLISTLQANIDEKLISKQVDTLIDIASEAIRFNLPCLLFAAGIITQTDLQMIEFLAQEDDKEIRKTASKLLIILKYLDLAALRALECTQLVHSQKIDHKILGNDSRNKKLKGSRAGVSFIFQEVSPEIIDREISLENFILSEIHTEEACESPQNTTKKQFEIKGFEDEDLVEFKKNFDEEIMIYSHTSGNINEKERLRIDESDVEKFICAEVKIKETTGEEKKMLEIPRLCTLNVVYGVFLLSRNGKEKLRKGYILHAIFPDPGENYMAKNARQVLQYFLQQKSHDCYNMNILPHYLNVSEIQITKGFYSEFNKHGNLENFVLTKKRTSLAFLLEAIRSIISSQTFFWKKHGMIHLEPFLYSVFVTRKIQMRLGYLNKIYILKNSKLEEAKFQENHAEYKRAMIYPSELLSSAREVFDEKQFITEKTAVFAIANVAMTLIFGIKPQASKKTLAPIDLISKIRAGTLTLGYLPIDMSAKGAVEIMEPLHKFLRASLDPNPVSRPSLVEMGVFFSFCLKALELMYL